MALDQIIAGASPGDAITTQALELQGLLGGPEESRIYAANLHPHVDGRILYLGDFQPRSNDTPVLYRASIGDPAIVSFFENRFRGPVVLHYHNITPAELVRPYAPAFADLLDLGRRELRLLKERTLFALADSDYNAEELRALGYSDVRTVPPIVQLDRLAAAPRQPLPGWEHVDEPLVLFVSQLMPHKRPDLAIAAYEILSRYLEPDVRLALVGADRLPAFGAAVECFLRELHLPRARIVRDASDGELGQLFDTASVFVSTSEHEGFGVPFVEAMAFDVPIVARRIAAVPETVGDAGLLLDPDDGPAVIAEAIHSVLSDRLFADTLRERGRERLGAFDPDLTREHLLEQLDEVR